MSDEQSSSDGEESESWRRAIANRARSDFRFRSCSIVGCRPLRLLQLLPSSAVVAASERGDDDGGGDGDEP